MLPTSLDVKRLAGRAHLRAGRSMVPVLGLVKADSPSRQWQLWPNRDQRSQGRGRSAAAL
jgi:hypothetical protein